MSKRSYRVENLIGRLVSGRRVIFVWIGEAGVTWVRVRCPYCSQETAMPATVLVLRRPGCLSCHSPHLKLSNESALRLLETYQDR